MLKASVARESLTNSIVEELKTKITEELNYVKKTESAFEEMGKKEQSGSAQIFFDDIRVGYSNVLADLSAKPLVETRAGMISVAWAPQVETGEGKRYPLAAQVVFGAFELNQRAYMLVADTQSLIFDLEVNSNPEGATISYRRRGDSYKPHPNPTNSVVKALPYAIWTIRVEKHGFREQEIDFNPFVNSNHVVNANLTK
jgi:hypothetical protein